MSDRIGEFVAYHMNGDGECNGILLKAWADMKELRVAKRFNLAFFYATVYNIPSAIFMLGEDNEIVDDPDAWCAENRGSLIFQSDRRYMRCNGALERTLEHFSRNLAGGEAFVAKTVHGKEIDTAGAISLCQEWPNYGRFGAYLFTETLTYLLGLESANRPAFDFANGATATSGVMNVFGLDAEADGFDRCKRIPENVSLEQLDAFLATIADAVDKAGGDSDIACLETSLCAYRKFFKGSRYNGYYLDRQLEELMAYPSINPSCADAINELYDLRAELFDHRYLGEFGGWDGVRKDCKRLYRDAGVMM